MHSKLFSLQLQLHSVYLVRTLKTDETCSSFWCSYLTEKTYCGLKWVAGMWHASPASTWYDCQTEHNNVCRFDNDVNQLMPLSVSHEISHTLCCCLRFQSHRPERKRKLSRSKRLLLGMSRVMCLKTCFGTLCPQEESANDLWHMDNFSHGIDHFLIRIITIGWISAACRDAKGLNDEWMLLIHPRWRCENWAPWGQRSCFLLQFLLSSNCQSWQSAFQIEACLITLILFNT